MPQSPIAAQAFGRAPNLNFKPLLCDSNGYLYASASPGKSLFVNETTGDDTNPGTYASPFATLAAALAACSANSGDTVFLTGTVHLTETLVWNKNGVNLIGLLSPSNNCRSRISSSGSTVFTPMVSVTAQGCRFENIATFYGYNSATAQVCWSDTGGRNYYGNVQFLGGGDATAAAQAGMRSLVVGGEGENVFEGCTFGLDTIQRITNANATLEFTGGTARNVIRKSIFQSYNGLAGNVHILIGAGGMDRYVLLDDVSLLNFGTDMDSAISNAGGSPAGNVVLTPTCVSIGATAIGAAGSIYVSGAVPTEATSNIGVLSHA